MVSVTIAKRTFTTNNSDVYSHYDPVTLRTDLTFDLFAGNWMH